MTTRKRHGLTWHADTLLGVLACRAGERAMTRRYARAAARKAGTVAAVAALGILGWQQSQISRLEARPAVTVRTSAATAPRCPLAARQCVTTPPGGIGQADIAAGGNHPGTPWIVADPHGAPMAWVNLYGLYSGGDGGKMPGGLICSTYGVAGCAAELTPTGQLVLRSATPRGLEGKPATLTARVLAWLIAYAHRHGAP